MNNLKNKNIALLVTGSIAAYKTPELVRMLIKEGANVRVVLSKDAKNFVTELTLQTVSKNKVFTNMFDLTEEKEIGHISLPDSSDVILVAPATANILAKASLGISDDLVSTILLASIKPIIFCPGMNVNMWNAVTTKEHVSNLKKRGCHFVEPTEGDLACGWVGQGRMAELNDIVSITDSVLNNYNKKLNKFKIIVTAGATREMIDPIRFISNKSSGKMGFALATAAKKLGSREVVLISGPNNLISEENIKLNRIESAKEMEHTLREEIKKESDSEKIIIFMASAVSDHKPKSYSETKLKYEKTQNTVLDLEINPDIICNISRDRDTLVRNNSTSNKDLFIVGFAAETGSYDDLIRYATKKLVEKNLDLIVANFSEENMGTESGRVWILDKNGKIEQIGPKNKSDLANDIINYCLNYLIQI